MLDEAVRKQCFDIKDPAMRKYLYLDFSIDELLDKILELEFTDIGDNKEIPFTASMRGYQGAKDQDGCSWLIKEIPKEEALDHKLQEIAYYIDFVTNTLAAPNILKFINGKPFRVTKNVRNAMQISSYNYMEEPFIKVLANDLINRWIFFDEDRNPNNYLIFHDKDDVPKIIAIDYNKADLRSAEMKITGNDEKFGWHRLEKTRFLTLLKPDHFDNLSIDIFEQRLSSFENFSEKLLRHIMRKAMSNCDHESIGSAIEDTIDLVVDNFKKRRDYLSEYFRRWFKAPTGTAKKEADRYAGFGQSFLDYYNKK
jgi:hypothetical protein